MIESRARVGQIDVDQVQQWYTAKEQERDGRKNLSGFAQAGQGRSEEEGDEEEAARQDVGGRRQAGDGRAAEDVQVDLLQRVDAKGRDLRQQAQTEDEREGQQQVQQQRLHGVQVRRRRPLVRFGG